MPTHPISWWIATTWKRAEEIQQNLTMSQAKGIAKAMSRLEFTGTLDPNDPCVLDRYVLDYADPTGEIAVRNTLAA